MELKSQRQSLKHCTGIKCEVKLRKPNFSNEDTSKPIWSMVKKPEEMLTCDLSGIEPEMFS